MSTRKKIRSFFTLFLISNLVIPPSFSSFSKNTISQHEIQKSIPMLVELSERKGLKFLNASDEVVSFEEFKGTAQGSSRLAFLVPATSEREKYLKLVVEKTPAALVLSIFNPDSSDSESLGEIEIRENSTPNELSESFHKLATQAANKEKHASLSSGKVFTLISSIWGSFVPTVRAHDFMNHFSDSDISYLKLFIGLGALFGMFIWVMYSMEISAAVSEEVKEQIRKKRPRRVAFILSAVTVIPTLVLCLFRMLDPADKDRFRRSSLPEQVFEPEERVSSCDTTLDEISIK